MSRPLFPAFQRTLSRHVGSERAIYLAVGALAFLARIWDVGTRAMHHDESIHATYAWYLFKGMGYQYNPVTHGPLQFFVMAVFYLLFGDSETTARLFAVLCGSAIVGLPYFLRHEMGRAGALIAAIALAVSPAFLYYSRFARDDIYLCFFACVMAVALWQVLREPVSAVETRTLTRRRKWNVFIFAGASALALSTMEAAYILFFVFGSFMALCIVCERFKTGSRPVTDAIRSIPLDVWMYALAVVIVVTILLYSSFFTNPQGVFDPYHGLISPDRRDILGGLTYWLSQHGVARGGQPWFYYLLLLPLYEQFALLFGAVGVAWAFLHRSLFVSFLAYWLVLSLAIYSWAGEKMPWLLLHPLLPATLLAATFAGHLLRKGTVPGRAALLGVLGVLLIAEAHSAQALAYSDGANPTEMLIYVQTSNDVPMVTHEVIGLARTHPSTPGPFVEVDSADLQGWPFEWYFRNIPPGEVSYTDNFAHATAPVLILQSGEEARFGPALRRRYVVSRYVWNWWFPEQYKGLTFDEGKCGTAANETNCPPGQTGTVFLRTGTPCAPQALVAESNCSLIQSVPAINVFDAAITPSTWRDLWNWFVFRTPFGTRGSRELYLFVRKDLVPKNSGGIGQTGQGQPPEKTLSFAQAAVIGGAGQRVLENPRGVDVSDGRAYIADSGTHRVDEYTTGGRFIRSIGSAGLGAGKFNLNQSPMDVAVAGNGDLYVADFWGHRIEEFAPGGKFLRAWGHYGTSGPYGFFGPRAVAVMPSGNVVVADTGNRRIAVFSGQGRFLFQFGSAGQALGQFEEPSSVAVSADGRIYVSDFWNSRIQYFTPLGRYMGSWPMPDWQNGSYEEPYLAVLSNQDVAAADPSAAAINLYKPDGKEVGAISTKGLIAPLGIFAGPHRSLLVSDFGESGVRVLRPSHP